MNNKLVTSNMDTYPYRAYLENLFYLRMDVKDNQLKAGEFWYEDEPDEFDDLTHANVKARAKPVAESKSLELQGRLHLDLVLHRHIFCSLRTVVASHSQRSQSEYCQKSCKISHKTCRSENIHDRYGFMFENRRSSLPMSTSKTCIHRYDQQRSFQRFF